MTGTRHTTDKSRSYPGQCCTTGTSSSYSRKRCTTCSLRRTGRWNNCPERYCRAGTCCNCNKIGYRLDKYYMLGISSRTPSHPPVS